ncbi:hypothetical protein TNCV_3415861 [Trichonephila clavipes]|nr:hypothetical protein TNCV_3415861 [Trichonephila clavipes]
MSQFERGQSFIIKESDCQSSSHSSTIHRVACTRVQHDSPQTTERAEFTADLYAAYLSHHEVQLQWRWVRSMWKCTEWGRIVVSDKSRLQLCPDGNHRRVWKHPGQRGDPALIIAHHISPQYCRVMI